MKRLVAYKELRYEFPNRVRYHAETSSDADIQIRMSYKTAFLFIDGQNVCTFYPSKTDKPEFWIREIKEYCEDYGYNISDEKALELAKYMIDNVR